MPKQSAPVAPLSTHRPVLDFISFALALLGILVVVHLWIQSGRGFDRGCFGFSAPTAQDATFNCEAVVNSDAGKLLGVSNVIWGLGFYLVIAALSFLVVTRPVNEVRKFKSLRAVMLIGGILYSGYLSYVQYFQLGEFCKLCLISASIVALLFLVLLADYLTKPGRGDSDAPALLRRVPFLGALAGIIAVVSAVDIAYFNGLDAASATVAIAEPVVDGPVNACRYDATKPRVENYLDMVSFSDPSKGNPNAQVVVIEFFDPMCPHCKTMNPVMKQVIAEYGDKARFVYRPFVLSGRSMQQVEALYAAAQEGKFFEMLDKQFDLQSANPLTMAQFQQIAGEIGLDWSLLKHRLDNQMFRNIAIRHRNAASDAGIGVVPTVMINGRITEGSARTVDCLKQMIDEATPSPAM
ncbi:MAG: vitamin K epoxide reductase family protein [Bacteroidetes bacterium]|nr:vitamin K epoxide reductase family protein [Bacteroidota bacterium]